MTDTTTTSPTIYGVLLDTHALIKEKARVQAAHNGGREIAPDFDVLGTAVRVVEFASSIKDGATCFRTLHDLYALIGCDLVEHVSAFEPAFDVWVDEEGMVCPKTVDTELGEMATVTEFHGVDLHLWGRIVFTGAGDGKGGTQPKTRDWAETVRHNLLGAMARGALRVHGLT